MCGICGLVNFNAPSKVDGYFLQRMCQTLQHRGPDDEGYYEKDGAGLAMRRLSIIDISGGHQPISNEDQTIWIVCNGEIYNFRSLREDLQKKGHRFKTNSDTETIIHAYEEYGEDCVTYLNGMFGFAIWDEKQRKLLLARDHIGIKPLFYSYKGNKIWFGSEIKALLQDPAVERELDIFALDQFLSLEYIPAPRTIYKNIKKLPAGHYLVAQPGKFKIQKYWDITPEPVHQDIDTCSEQLADLLSEAVRMQMISDVPLGAFLSGGIDSSSVVAFMSRVSESPVKTFSIGFDDNTYNELPYAREVAWQFATEHHEEILSPDISDLCERLVTHFDEPFGDFSIFPTYLVSTVARNYVKVALSGDGGDELFGGYDTYRAQKFDNYYRFLPGVMRQKTIPAILARVPPNPAKKGMINIAKRITEGAALDPSLRHTRWMIFFNEHYRNDVYQPDFYQALDDWSIYSVFNEYFDRAEHFSSLAQQQYVDIKTYLVDNILVKVDRMSMAVSLETRVPMLDYRIVEFALNLPDDMKIHKGQTKRVLKEAVRGIVPDRILSKPKQGFSIPIKNWLRGPLKPFMLDLLGSQTHQERGFFRPKAVSKMIDDHLNNKADHSHRLWALMVFELWLQHDTRKIADQ
jgi:asparagine synthase (glutamine-hydrolysing)